MHNDNLHATQDKGPHDEGPREWISVDLPDPLINGQAKEVMILINL